MVVTSGYEPLAMVDGTVTPIWNNPALPEARNARFSYTVSGMLLSVTVTLLAVEKVGVAGIATPNGFAGEVGPKPEPQMTIVSPGAAGTVVIPGIEPFAAA